MNQSERAWLDGAGRGVTKVFPGSESKAAKVFPKLGRSAPLVGGYYHDEIILAVETRRLSVKRVWLNLVEDYGYAPTAMSR